MDSLPIEPSGKITGGLDGKEFACNAEYRGSKPSGGDGIPVELFQILKDNAVKVLYSICQQIWKTQQWPQRKRCRDPRCSPRGNPACRGTFGGRRKAVRDRLALQGVATAAFSKFAGILSAELTQHYLSGFEIAQLDFHHLH